MIKKSELDEIYNLVIQRRVADHDMEGILIMEGKDIQQGVKVDAKAVDIAPTLLYLHGLPVLDTDGRVLREALSEELSRKRRVRKVKVFSWWGNIERQHSKREQEEIEKHLRDWGYL